MSNKQDKLYRDVRLRMLGTEYKDFRIDFDIRKDLAGEPNEAKIHIYGLSPETRARALENEFDTVIQLYAGYEGNVAKLFEGQPIQEGVTEESDGPDKEIIIEAAGGRSVIKTTKVSYSVDQVRTYQEAVNEFTMVAARGNPRLAERPIEIQPDLPNGHKQLPAGMVYSGNLPEIADSLAEDLDADWSFQNGVFVFLHKEATRPRPGPLFSDETGNLIHGPSPKEGGIEITVLLEDIEPGQQFKVKSRTRPQKNGVYKATSVHHTGSRYEDNFYTTIEGRAV